MPPSPMPGPCLGFRVLGIPAWLHWTFPGVGLGLGIPVAGVAWWARADAALPLFGWTVLAVAAIVLVHEAGHVIAARLLGLEVHGVCLAAGGACCLIGETGSPWQDLLYSASGLVAQLVLALALWRWLGPWTIAAVSDGATVLALVNAALWVLNAWPAGHSDGARIARAWRALRAAP